MVARWKRDKCAFTTMKKASDKEIVREVKQLLLEFKSLRSIYNWDGYASTSVKKEAERKYNKLDESDIFFKERKFVLALAEYNCDSHCKRSLFRLLAETHHYPLAQYMLNRPADGKIDGCYFATAEFPTQLNFIVNHLFEY